MSAQSLLCNYTGSTQPQLDYGLVKGSLLAVYTVNVNVNPLPLTVAQLNASAPAGQITAVNILGTTIGQNLTGLTFVAFPNQQVAPAVASGPYVVTLTGGGTGISIAGAVGTATLLVFA